MERRIRGSPPCGLNADGGGCRPRCDRKVDGMRFLCDHMLGTLAKWLRFLGYDTLYPGPLDDGELKALAERETRVLLTRDKQLSGRVSDSLYVDSDDLDAQFAQVVRAFSLNSESAMSRCSVCNELIEWVPKERAKGRVPE